MKNANRLPDVKLEDRIAAETPSGREALQVWREVWAKMSGQQRIEKAFQLTAEVRQFMRAGLRQRNPSASDEEIQQIYVDHLLATHGTSLGEIRSKQKEELER